MIMFPINSRTIVLTAAIGLSSIILQPLMASASKQPSVIRSNRSVQVYEPLCYIEIGSKRISLNAMCGVKAPVEMIGLKADRDGVSTQLLNAMRGHQRILASARSPQEYEAAERNFESRLPYSDHVRQLQEQVRSLKQKADQSNTWEKTAKFIELISKVETKIANDPSYKAVQIAMSKVSKRLEQG
jgi:hypothetical protein